MKLDEFYSLTPLEFSHYLEGFNFAQELEYQKLAWVICCIANSIGFRKKALKMEDLKPTKKPSVFVSKEEAQKKIQEIKKKIG